MFWILKKHYIGHQIFDLLIHLRDFFFPEYIKTCKYKAFTEKEYRTWSVCWRGGFLPILTVAFDRLY